MAESRRVCVTGAGGYVASWLVKLLLSKGFIVHGTVRDPDDPKNTHLRKLDNAENLHLFKADLLDYESLSAAIAGCEGVFHVACPVPVQDFADPEVEMIPPAVDGTLNVLKACSKGVRRIVLVSSLAAVGWNLSWPLDKVVDEDCWSDKEFCKNAGFWYAFSKTVSEEKAVDYSKSNGLDLVTLCPSLVIGPLLQPTINASIEQFIEFLKGNRISLMAHDVLFLVDVRDVADALLLVYEKSEAGGRYICHSYSMKMTDFCDKLKNLYPNFPYPNCTNEEKPLRLISSEKLMRLGWKQIPLEDSIQDTVQDFLNKNILNVN
ncbi:cinnamoyl-CoA reductase 1-like [Wolffia australiana]